MAFTITIFPNCRAILIEMGQYQSLYIVTNVSCGTNCFALLNNAMLLDIFLHWCSLWLSHFNCSSSIIPRVFLCFTCLISCPSITIFGLFVIDAKRYLDPKTMNSVFTLFGVSLFPVNHLWIFSTSWFSLLSISVWVNPSHEILVSSANKAAFVVSKQFVKSLIYRRNRSGPSFEPSGILQLISLVLESLLLTLYTCFLPFIYDLKHMILISREIKFSWFIVSSAFLRSKKSTPLIRPLSILNSHSFVETMSAVSVECWMGNPDCCLAIIILSNINLLNWSYIYFSKSFTTVEITEIGQ